MTWKIYCCRACGWRMASEQDDLACERCGESRSMVEQLEVAPVDVNGFCPQCHRIATVWGERFKGAVRVRKLVDAKLKAAESEIQRLREDC